MLLFFLILSFGPKQSYCLEMIHLQIDKTVPHSILQIMAFDRSCLHLLSIKQQTDGLVSSTAGFGLGEQIKEEKIRFLVTLDGCQALS